MSRAIRACTAVLATLIPLASACVSFQPSRTPSPAPGTRIEARFSPPAELVLATEAIPMPVRQVVGTVVATGPDTLWLSPHYATVGYAPAGGTTADAGFRRVTSGFDARVAVSRQHPGLELREWRFSPKRTAAVVGAAALVAGLLALAFADMEFDYGDMM